MRRLTALALLIAGTAHAVETQQLRCTQTFNGEEVLILDTFPATVKVKLTITNLNTSQTSVALAIDAPILQSLFMKLTAPLPVAAGASFVSEKTLAIPHLTACNQVSAWDGEVDAKVASAVELSWTGGSSHCSGAIVCRAAQVCR